MYCNCWLKYACITSIVSSFLAATRAVCKMQVWLLCSRVWSFIMSCSCLMAKALQGGEGEEDQRGGEEGGLEGGLGEARG